MPSVRSELGKQVSEIPRPKITSAKGIAILSPETTDLSGEVLGLEVVMSIGGKFALQKPAIVDISESFLSNAEYSIIERDFEFDLPCIFGDIQGCALPIKSYLTEIDLIHPVSTHGFLQEKCGTLKSATLDEEYDTCVPLVGTATSIPLNPTISMLLTQLEGWKFDALGFGTSPVISEEPHEFIIQEVTFSDGFGFLLQEIMPSQDYVEELPVATVEEPLELIANLLGVGVSNNQFISIRIESIMGMNYADRHWQEEKLPKPDQIEKTKKGTSSQQSTTPRKVGRPSKNGNKPKPSFWDLLFVVLQPPLSFVQAESLFLPHSLYPYQVQGVEFLVTNEHALLADDMGTGKTVMTTVALKILFQSAQVHHALILCPPSVLHEWRRHLEEWASELATFFVRGGQETRELIWDMAVHIYVTAYDILARDLESGRLPKEMLGVFDVVVLDEAHNIRNPNSRRARAIKRLKPQKRWALTGTPIQNKLDDIASIFDFVHPGYITPYDMYPSALMAKIQPHFLRRRKDDVMPDLPPKTRQPIWMELDAEQQKIYDRVERDIQVEIREREGVVTKQHVLAKIQLLKQLCNFPPGSISGPKIEQLREQIEDIVESGNKVIVFSQYNVEGVAKLEKAINHCRFGHFKPRIEELSKLAG